MDKTMSQYAVFKQLEVLRNVRHRLSALAVMPDVPVGAATQLKLEAECIAWAYEELRTKHLVRCAWLVGDEAFNAFTLPPNYADYSNGLFATCLVEPDDVTLQKIVSLVSTPNWEGNKLSAKTPPFLTCDRFFACRDENGKRMVFFDLVVHRGWLNEKGMKEVKREIDIWLHSTFGAMDWDQAKPLNKP
jgi:hypothetical protein